MLPSHPSDNLLAPPADVASFPGPLFAELVATSAFQRLQSIHFLGGIDYLLIRFPNGFKGNIRHTRFQHSLGVARLALLYSNLQDLAFADRRHVCAAALLHDIGHAPLSHSLEPVFEEVFGIEHHQATENILTGRVPLGREVYETLHRHRADVERIVALIAGDETDHRGFFSGPINFDTIEGILRTLNYTKLPLSVIPASIVVEAAFQRKHDRHRDIVDDFWRRKDLVYRHIINSHTGILADYACQSFMRERLHRITPDDYYGTENLIFDKLSGLRQLLTSRTFTLDILKRLHNPVSYTARRFSVLSEGNFFARDDKARYRQTREPSILSPQTIELMDISEDSEGDLFNDPSNQARKGPFRR